MELPPPKSEADRERRLALARQAFRDFKVECFWTWENNFEITEETIPLIVKELRLHGGHAGYRVVAEMSR